MRYNIIILLVITALTSCVPKLDFEKKYNTDFAKIEKYRDEYLDIKKNISDNQKNISKHRKHKQKHISASIYSRNLALNLLPALLSKTYGVVINMSQTSDLLVSLNYSNISLEDLLNQITDLYNVGFSKTESGYNMYVNAVRTRFFMIKYHNFVRNTKSATVIQGNGFNSTQSSEASTDTSSATSGDISSSKGGYSSINTNTNDQFWPNISAILTQITKDGAPENTVNISINQDTGLVIASTYPRNLRNIEQLIENLNKASSKQIIIEAKLLEVALNDEYTAGINWSMLNQTINVNYTPPTSSAISSLIPVSSGLLIRAHGKNYFDAVLNALSIQGKVTTLSSPRISISNNQRALIKFGVDAYYVTNVNGDSTRDSTGTNTTTSSVNLTPIFSGIALDASPRIIDNNNIILHVHPTVTAVTEQNKTIQYSGVTNVIPLPVIKSREVDTIVNATNYDIVVIGGLMTDTTSLYDSGPNSSNSFLDKLLGIFSSKRHSRQRSELAILMRLIIVDSDDPIANQKLKHDIDYDAYY